MFDTRNPSSFGRQAETPVDVALGFWIQLLEESSSVAAVEALGA